MSELSWFYLAVLVLTFLVTLIVDFSVKIGARIRWIRTSLLLLVAIAAALIAWRTALTLDTRILGWFVAGMCLMFACWRRGLANWAVIAGLGAVRVWGAISKVEIHTTKVSGRNEVWTYVGTIRVSRLVFNHPVVALQAFLQKHLRVDQVSVVKN